jgi:hypothetical protein
MRPTARRTQRSGLGSRLSWHTSAAAICLIGSLIAIGNTSADAQPRSDRDLIAAQADTIRALQWLLEDERTEHGLALSYCEERADSLQIDLRWTQRLLDREPDAQPGSPVWAALGSRTAVFCYGFLAGVYTTVQVMHAVD